LSELVPYFTSHLLALTYIYEPAHIRKKKQHERKYKQILNREIAIKLIAINVWGTAGVLICAYYVLETLKVKANNIPIYVRYR
jgi:hypothetical protein